MTDVLPDTTRNSLSAMAEDGDLADACKVVEQVRMAANNGSALAVVLAYRFRVREGAIESKGIPSDMLLVNKEEFDRLCMPSETKEEIGPIEKGVVDDLRQCVMQMVDPRAPYSITLTRDKWVWIWERCRG